MQRIALVGTAGAGKSHLAQRLSARLDLPVIELDALFWLPGWQNRTALDFRARVDHASAEARWLIVGNYSTVRDLVWTRADTLIWLDYPLTTIMPRLLLRTIRRIRSQEDLWGTGNRESLRRSFADRHSILLWALTTWRRNRASFERAIADPQFAHLTVHRLRRRIDAEQLLRALGGADGL